MTFLLNATKRTTRGDKARTATEIPAILYGAGGDPINVSLQYSEFAKLQHDASESSLIDLSVDGAAAGKILLQDVQFDPVSGRITHADLRRIDMSKPIIAKVELKFIGEAPAIKELGGTLVHNVNELEVRCLPADLVSYIEVNINGLKTFADMIKVKDLPVPATITVLAPKPENVVAKAQAALTEEQIKAMEESSTAAADLTKIEVAGKKKEEEEVAAEGEAAPAGKDDKKKEEAKPEKK